MTNTNRRQGDPDKILAALKRSLNDRTRWDELPEWGWLLSAADGGIRTRPMPVPAQAWREMGDPKRVLHGFLGLLTKPLTTEAAAVGKDIRLSLGKDFAGLYMRTEGWAPPENRAPEVYRRIETGGTVPRFASMEGREEIRLMSAVDTAGNRYLVQQPRRTMRLDGYCVTETSSQGPKLSGEVPALLSRLLDTLLTPPPAARREARRNGR